VRSPAQGSPTDSDKRRDQAAGRRTISWNADRAAWRRHRYGHAPTSKFQVASSARVTTEVSTLAVTEQIAVKFPEG
jgi:hypothetical protein